MAYVTGSASSASDLLTALQNACTANGWALNGSVLSKGACYAQVTAVGATLQVLGGTGIDGSNALTSAGPLASRLGTQIGTDTVGWPVTYAVHVLTNPDEVYLVINYGVVCWQWLAFGCSPVAGLPGTGNWYAATAPAIPGITSITLTPTSGGQLANSSECSAALFATTMTTSFQPGHNTFFHHGFDGASWSTNAVGSGPNQTAPAILYSVGPLLARQPSLWNGEAVLLPIQPCMPRLSGKVSMAGELGHARV